MLWLLGVAPVAALAQHGADAVEAHLRTSEPRRVLPASDALLEQRTRERAHAAHRSSAKWYKEYLERRKAQKDRSKEAAEGARDLVEATTEDNDKLEDAQRAWDRKYPQLQRDIRELMSSVETQASSLNSASDSTLYDVGTGLQRAPQVLPSLVNEGITQAKRSETRLEKDVDGFDKNSEGIMKTFGRETRMQEKMVEKNLDKEEKTLTREMKDAEKDMRKQTSSNEKYLNAESRKVSKLEEGVEESEEETDSALKEQFETVATQDAELASLAENVEMSLEKTGNVQEKAQEQMERLSDAYYVALENTMQNTRNKGVIQAAADSQEIQKHVKNALLHIQALADGTYGDIETVEGLGRDLLNTEEMEFKSQDAKVQKLQRETEVGAHRLHAAEAKSQKQNERNQEEMEKFLQNMDMTVTQAIANLKTVGLKQVSDARAGLEAEIAQDQSRKTSKIDKEAEQILQDSETVADDTAIQYEKQMGRTATDLGKSQKRFEQTTNTAYQQEARANAAIEQIAKMDASMGTQLTAYGDWMANRGTEIEGQAGAASEEEINQLVEQAKQALERFQQQSDSLHKDTVGLGKELTEQTDSTVAAADAATDKMSGEAIRGLKQVAGFLKPVVEAQHLAQAQLGTAQEELSGITQDATKVKVATQEKLAQVGTDVSTAGEELQSKVVEQFAQEDEAQSGTIQTLTTQMEEALQQSAAKIGAAAKQVHDKIKDAAVADAQRVTSAAKRDQAAQMELTREQTQLGRMETDFGPKYQHLLGELHDSEAGIQDLAGSGSHAREEFANHAEKANQENIVHMETAMREELDHEVNKSHVQTQSLNEELKEARTEANSDKVATQKSIDEALAQTRAAYKQILGKIGKLHDQEVDVNDAEWSERTKTTLDRLKASAAEHMAKIQQLEDGFVAGQDNANTAIAQFHQEEHNSRSRFEEALTEMSSEFRKQEQATKQTITDEMVDGFRKARATQIGVEGEARQVQNAITADEDAVESQAARDMSNLKHVERKVLDQKRIDMQNLQRVAADMNRQRLAEQARASQVERDLEAETRGVHGEVQEMESGLGHMMDKLDPSAALAGVSASIHGVGQLMEQAQEQEKQKTQQVEHDVKVAGNQIEKILQEAQMEDSILSKTVMQIGLDVREKMRKASQLVEQDEHQIGDLVKDTTEMDKDLRRAATMKISKEFTLLGAHLEQLEKAVGLSSYQGEDALKKVGFVLDKAAAVDAGSKAGANDLANSTEVWRKAVETVFEGLGMALDLEKVERMAAESMAAEEANNGQLNDAKKAMEAEIRKIKQKMANEIDFVRAQAKAAIEAILADESLSDEEKQRRIAAIQKQADKDVMRLQMKMKQLIAEQYMSAHNLDEEIGGLNALLERAKLIAGAGTPEAAAWAKAMMKEVKSRLDVLRHRFTKEYSLAQTGGGAEQQLARIEREVQQAEQGAKAYRPQQARAAAFLQAGEELSCLETERGRQQQEWNEQLDALQKALPALTKGA